MAGFRRWVLAVAPVAPGVRAGLPADDGSRELPAGERDDTTGKGKDQDAERLPRDVAGQHEPRAQAEPPAPDTPGGYEIAPGETKRHALIRLYEHCGQTGDPRPVTAYAVRLGRAHFGRHVIASSQGCARRGLV